jgi:hypothetical protein
MGAEQLPNPFSHSDAIRLVISIIEDPEKFTEIGNIIAQLPAEMSFDINEATQDGRTCLSAFLNCIQRLAASYELVAQFVFLGFRHLLNLGMQISEKNAALIKELPAAKLKAPIYLAIMSYILGIDFTEISVADNIPTSTLLITGQDKRLEFFKILKGLKTEYPELVDLIKVKFPDEPAGSTQLTLMPPRDAPIEDMISAATRKRFSAYGKEFRTKLKELDITLSGFRSPESILYFASQERSETLPGQHEYMHKVFTAPLATWISLAKMPHAAIYRSELCEWFMKQFLHTINLLQSGATGQLNEGFADIIAEVVVTTMSCPIHLRNVIHSPQFSYLMVLSNIQNLALLKSRNPQHHLSHDRQGAINAILNYRHHNGQGPAESAIAKLYYIRLQIAHEADINEVLEDFDEFLLLFKGMGAHFKTDSSYINLHLITSVMRKVVYELTNAIGQHQNIEVVDKYISQLECFSSFIKTIKIIGSGKQQQALMNLLKKQIPTYCKQYLVSLRDYKDQLNSAASQSKQQERVVEKSQREKQIKQKKLEQEEKQRRTQQQSQIQQHTQPSSPEPSKQDATTAPLEAAPEPKAETTAENKDKAKVASHPLSPAPEPVIVRRISEEQQKEHDRQRKAAYLEKVKQSPQEEQPDNAAAADSFTRHRIHNPIGSALYFAIISVHVKSTRIDRGILEQATNLLIQGLTLRFEGNCIKAVDDTEAGRRGLSRENTWYKMKFKHLNRMVRWLGRVVPSESHARVIEFTENPPPIVGSKVHRM